MTKDQLEPINNRSSSITQLEGEAKVDPQTSLDTNETEYEQSRLQKTKDQPLHNDDDENAKLIQEEEMMTGNVGWHVFMKYARACTLFYAFLSAAGFIGSQACQIGASKWLEIWSASNDRSENIGKYLGVYGALIAGYIFFDIFVNYCVFALAGIHASRVLHHNLLRKVLTLPMSFFDTTP
ncbi:Multidrug resistance-associated protein 1, partial [Actinomortierella wolfii]